MKDIRDQSFEWFVEVKNYVEVFIYFQVKELGDTALTVTSTTSLPDLVPTNADAKHADNLAIYNTFVATIRTQLNAIENKMNGYTTPDCSS